MKNFNLQEKRTHGEPEFRFSIEEVFSNKENTVFSPLHFHSEFEFCVVDDGNMTIQLNDSYITLSKGEGIFINSQALHSVLSAEHSGGHLVILMFDSALILSEKDIVRDKYILPLINGEISVYEKLNIEECALILKAKEVYERKDFGYELEMKCYALRLITKLLTLRQRVHGKTPGKNVEIIKKALEYIHDNYQNNITLSEMASHVFVSPEHLCRVFSQLSDVSPFQYLNRYRIIQSTAMLADRSISIAKIATCVGFNSSSYYNKMFMRYMGCTPSQYRSGL